MAAVALGIVGTTAACTDDNAEPDPAARSTSSAATVEIERVIIVGAGAAGMSAGHYLAQQGVDFTIVEAGPTYGGRIKTIDDFVDFPIPLGGEWIHARESILEHIVKDDSVSVTTAITPYAPTDRSGTYVDGVLSVGDLGKYTDLKFVGGTWLTFFETYVLPGIADHMVFDRPVVAVERDADGVTVTDATGQAHRGDAVIVTVPLQILKDGDIEFTPPLPAEKLDAIDTANVWGGMKVFLEFSERFYPVFVEFDDSETDAGQRTYYDAAYGQDTTANVLGLFSVGEQAEQYQSRSGDELLQYILGELDEVFDGAASRTYVQHVAQNWNDEPFIRQGYLADVADWKLPPIIREPVDGRLYFAGDAYTSGTSWSEVHMAAQSAREAVVTMLR